MYIYVLNKELKRIGLIDNYVSIIWTTRYYEAGDFELYVPITDEFIDLLQMGYYLQTNNSDRTMIIETIKLDTDTENGNYMTVSGRSIESLLERRILNRRQSINTDLNTWLTNAVKYNFVSTDSDRIIDIIDVATNDVGSSIDIQAQYLGENIYEIIVENCKTYNLGFKMPFVNGKFVFTLYEGKDRTLSQKVNEPAIFSPNFENLVNTSYSYSSTNIKNAATIAGEGEGSDRKVLSIGTASGLDRYEIFVDARDVSSKVDDTTLTDAQYNAQLRNRGREKLAEYSNIQEFVGEVTNYPEYCELGDIVQVKNEFGMTATTRITEIIESDSTSGYTKIPTFDEWRI